MLFLTMLRTTDSVYPADEAYDAETCSSQSDDVIRNLTLCPFFLIVNNEIFRQTANVRSYFHI